MIVQSKTAILQSELAIVKIYEVRHEVIPPMRMIYNNAQPSWITEHGFASMKRLPKLRMFY